MRASLANFIWCCTCCLPSNTNHRDSRSPLLSSKPTTKTQGYGASATQDPVTAGEYTLPEVDTTIIKMGPELINMGPELIDMGPELGRGGYAIVCEATIEEIQYAIKRPRNDGNDTTTYLNKNIQTEITAFKGLQEKARQIGIEACPYVIKMIKASRYMARPMIILEYLPKAKELLDHIFDKTVDPTWFGQTAAALEYLHDCHFIHRDIKPENIMIHENRHGELVVKLVDFGYAIDQGAARDQLCTRCGTEEYMAPEIAHMRGAVPASDLWSLGCVIFAAATIQTAVCRSDSSGDQTSSSDPSAQEKAMVSRAQSAVKDKGAPTCLPQLFCIDPKKRPSAKTVSKLLADDITKGHRH